MRKKERGTTDGLETTTEREIVKERKETIEIHRVETVTDTQIARNPDTDEKMSTVQDRRRGRIDDTEEERGVEKEHHTETQTVAQDRTETEDRKSVV